MRPIGEAGLLASLDLGPRAAATPFCGVDAGAGNDANTDGDNSSDVSSEEGLYGAPASKATIAAGLLPRFFGFFYGGESLQQMQEEKQEVGKETSTEERIRASTLYGLKKDVSALYELVVSSSESAERTAMDLDQEGHWGPSRRPDAVPGQSGSASLGSGLGLFGEEERGLLERWLKHLEFLERGANRHGAQPGAGVDAKNTGWRERSVGVQDQ